MVGSLVVSLNFHPTPSSLNSLTRVPKVTDLQLEVSRIRPSGIAATQTAQSNNKVKYNGKDLESPRGNGMEVDASAREAEA